MTGEQRQALDDAIERVALRSVFQAYKKQHKETTKVYAQYNTRLPVGMWPLQKAPGARARPKPKKDISKSQNASYNTVVHRLELQALAQEDQNQLRVELSAAKTSEQEAAHSLAQQVAKRKRHHQQGHHRHNQIEDIVMNDCIA
jgi:hypothetical protein